MKIFSLVLAVQLLNLAQASGASKCHQALLQGPVAPVISHARIFHGEKLEDNYFWLRDEPKDGKYRPEIVEYIQAENQHSESYGHRIQAMEKEIYGELSARSAVTTSLSQSYQIGNYTYFQRQGPGQEFPVYLRRHLQSGQEEILLNANEMARGAKYFNLGLGLVSPDENLLPYVIDSFGNGAQALYVKNIKTGETRMIREKDVRNKEFAWSSDGRYLFYSVPGTLSRDSRVVRFDMQASDPKQAEVSVFDELDGDFYLYLQNTASRKYIVLMSRGGQEAMARVISADHPTESPVLLSPKTKNLKYQIDHVGDRFFFLANLGSVERQIFWAPETRPMLENWKKLVPQDSMTDVQKMMVFETHILALGVKNAFQKLMNIRLSDLSTREVFFKDPFYSVWPEKNINPHSKSLRLTYKDYLRPSALIELDLESNRWKAIEAPSFPNFKAEDFQVERLWATARDGTRIPYNMVSRRGLRRDGKNPVFMQAYGSYRASMITPFAWKTDLMSLLSRGVVVIDAFPRGGGEMGQQWGQDAVLNIKINTFTDIISVAEDLIQQGVTQSDRMALEGVSAGGLNVGYITNNRPELFKAIVAKVPFVDLINTMSDPSIPLTTQEYVEWGNPANAKDYAYMRKYSPYDNVGRHAYPSMLVVSAMGDSQVPYWEPLKWVARIRAQKTDQNPLLLQMALVGGHAGGTGVSGPLKDQAFAQSFILDQIGARK